MRTIALFGGSFNPPHEAHFETGARMFEALGVDEVWMMFSVNRFKDPQDYAPLEDRMAMGELLSRHYPDVPFVMTDIEERVGTHETYHILKALQAENPDCRFIWVMGADNLSQFHTWMDYDRFIQEFPIVVLTRPPYTEEALNSITAQTYDGLKVDEPEALKTLRAGWSVIDVGEINLSSSALVREMRAGRRDFDGPFQDIADYIIEHSLYGIGGPGPQDAPSPSAPAPRPL